MRTRENLEKPLWADLENRRPWLYPQSNGPYKAGVVVENRLFWVVDWRFFLRRRLEFRGLGRGHVGPVARGNSTTTNVAVR